MATGSQRWFDARKRSFWSGGMGWIKLGLTASYLRRGEASSYEHQPQEQCGPLMKSWGIVYDDLTRLRDPRHHLYCLTLKCLGLCPDDGSLLSAVVDESPHVTGHVDKGDASLTVVLLRRVRDPNTGLFPGGGSEFLMAELNAYLRTHFPADLPGDPPTTSSSSSTATRCIACARGGTRPLACPPSGPAPRSACTRSACT